MRGGGQKSLRDESRMTPAVIVRGARGSGTFLASGRWDTVAAQMPCASCKALIWVGPGSLPVGLATCRPCRREQTTALGGRKSPCVDCGARSYGDRCRGCEDQRRANSARMEDEVRLQRRALQARRALRARTAPGLSAPERRSLLRSWRLAGRTCAYCDNGSAETVDHVVPLALGGSNYEGNLVPSCRSCNARKNDSLLIAWRVRRDRGERRVA